MWARAVQLDEAYALCIPAMLYGLALVYLASHGVLEPLTGGSGPDHAQHTLTPTTTLDGLPPGRPRAAYEWTGATPGDGIPYDCGCDIP